MLRLAGKYSVPSHHRNLGKRTIIRISKTPLPTVLRKEEGYLLSIGETDAPRGYAVYVLVGENRNLVVQVNDVPIIVLPEECGFLGSGDIIRFDPENNSFRVLYRRTSA